MYNAEELINLICDAEYKYKDYEGKTATSKVVSCYSSSAESERSAIAQAVYTWLGNQQLDLEKDKNIGELAAKVYTYEAIIANSNFAPVLDTQQQAQDQFKDVSKVDKLFLLECNLKDWVQEHTVEFDNGERGERVCADDTDIICKVPTHISLRDMWTLIEKVKEGVI